VFKNIDRLWMDYFYFIIDKAYKPCCFNNAHQLPAEYAMNNKGWMPSITFNSMWNELWREKRKILL
jgi:hypothetical protein